MKKIGLLSDTHSVISPKFLKFFKDVDEIWHAGDWGNAELKKELEKIAPVRGVYGNVDGPHIHPELIENQIFFCEKVKVLITHIGGYPGRYEPRVRRLIMQEKPKLYIAGHSHILKVIYDDKYELLHINPGAAGNSGYHKISTVVRFVIDGEEIKDLEIKEIGRGAL